MKLIKLHNGMFTKVSDCDYTYLNQFKWIFSDKNNQRAIRRVKLNTGKMKTIQMSRDIMKPPNNMVVDHINHDTLNNTRENLRICEQKFNLRNAKVSRKNKYNLKGIYRTKSNTWKASFSYEGKYIYIGCYKCPAIAKYLYDRTIDLYFGDYARIQTTKYLDK